MPVPQPRLLSLGDAAYYVADRCDESIEEAKTALDRAFREYSLSVFSDRFQKFQDWQGAEIDWENSAAVGGEHLTINSVRYTVRISVFKTSPRRMDCPSRASVEAISHDPLGRGEHDRR
jgi:hypothetical protein